MLMQEIHSTKIGPSLGQPSSPGVHLLKWVDVDLSMNKWPHAKKSVRWSYVSIFKLHQCNRWNLEREINSIPHFIMHVITYPIHAVVCCQQARDTVEWYSQIPEIFMQIHLSILWNTMCLSSLIFHKIFTLFIVLSLWVASWLMRYTYLHFMLMKSRSCCTDIWAISRFPRSEWSDTAKYWPVPNFNNKSKGRKACNFPGNMVFECSRETCPDSKVHVAHHGSHLGPVGPRGGPMGGHVNLATWMVTDY